MSDLKPNDLHPPEPLSSPVRAEPGMDLAGLLPTRKPPPPGGIRRLLFRATGGLVNLGPSPADQSNQKLVERALAPAASGRRRIAAISLKGGVGKTTTTVMLGHTLASLRGDNVIAIDANPDAGNLVGRVTRQTTLTARDLLDAAGRLERYADARIYTSQAASRLEILAGESDPALSEAFSAADYEAVLSSLERFYSIVLTDCGTGILHDAMRAVLWYVDQLIVVTSPSIDSARALEQLLDWLDQHDCHHLVAGAVVVANGVQKRSEIRPDKLVAAIGNRCRGVITVPHDPALSTGGEANLEALGKDTRHAYLELAALVGDSFRQPRPPGHDPGGGPFADAQASEVDPAG